MQFIKLFYVFRKIGIIFVLRSSAKQNKDFMKNSTQKSIRNLSVSIFVIGGLTFLYIFVQMILQVAGSHYFTPVTWNPDIKGWQIFIIAGRFVGITLLFAQCCIFLYRINKGLKEGEIFPRSNVSLIRRTAVVAALLAFVQSNYGAAARGESTLVLDTNFFLFPLVVLLFAGLYKLACLAAEDSKLAI